MQSKNKKLALLFGSILVVGLIIASFFGIQFFTDQDSGLDLFGPPGTIVLDGRFEEWSFRTPVYSDPTGDNSGDTIDFTSLYLDNDQKTLYLEIELNIETNLQNGSDLILYIDSDNNPDTGEDFNGLGADLVYELGNRRGRYYQDGLRKALEHDFIGLISMPTVTSETFEIGIARTFALGGAPVFTSDEIKVAFAHDIDGGDILPEPGDTVAYTFTQDQTIPPASITLEKNKPSDLRIVSWNTLNDGFLNDKRAEHFYNVLRAIDADIINLQEMYATQADDVQAQMEVWFPDTDWHVYKMGDLVTISRYPIVEPAIGAFPIISGGSTALIELPKGERLLIVNTHFRCCDEDELRQRQVDELMKMIRDIKTPGDRVDLPVGTPMIILGDMNLVGLARQVETLLYGDILDEEYYGADIDPDWDGSPLTDLLSRHTENLHTYTWRDEKTSFSPGRLDYIIYADSVLKVVKHFILDTAELPGDKLAYYGLQEDDSLNATDHLTFVADFVIK